MMNALIGFEESATVRDTFRKAGYNAWSCDLEPSRGDSRYHLQIDIFRALTIVEWDLIILHPPCTALTVAGNSTYAKGRLKHHQRLAAIAYTNRLWYQALRNGKRVCLENPQGVLHTNTDLPKPQYIQPYQFGHNASKKTGLTLHNLPRLALGERVTGRFVNNVERWDNQTDSGQNKLPPGPTRARDRSVTYQGIADAMVEQWGGL